MRVNVALISLIGIALAQSSELKLSRASRTVTGAEPEPLKHREALLASLITVEQLDGWVSGWQKRLGLEGWAIEARIVRYADLPRGAVANIRWSLRSRKATIRVLHPLDSRLEPSAIARDTELSVVHELIHLSLAKLPLDANHTDQEEEAVKRISSALLGLQERHKPLAAEW